MYMREGGLSGNLGMCSSKQDTHFTLNPDNYLAALPQPSKALHITYYKMFLSNKG